MGMATIPERLVKAREFIGHNRKSFAEKLNIPYRTITNYENGSREPGSDYILKVANICGCTTDWLLGLSDNPRNNSPYTLMIWFNQVNIKNLYRLEYYKKKRK